MRGNGALRRGAGKTKGWGWLGARGPESGGSEGSGARPAPEGSPAFAFTFAFAFAHQATGGKLAPEVRSACGAGEESPRFETKPSTGQFWASDANRNTTDDRSWSPSSPRVGRNLVVPLFMSFFFSFTYIPNLPRPWCSITFPL